MNGAEIDEFAPKVGVKVPLETRTDPDALRAPLQFLIRRCAWHMLDHA